MRSFVVIGGQYHQVVYGDAATLTGAKRIASRHCEYWDNWQGWHKPAIYSSADCNADGYHDIDAVPVATWDDRHEKWINLQDRPQ